MNTATLERPMITAMVTVQNVYQPKPGRKSGTVKDVDGQLFSAFPDTLRQILAGETYEFAFTEKNINGVIYRDIKHVTAQRAPQRPERPARSLSSAATQEPARQHNGNGNGHYRPTSPQDAERMFVCKLLGDFIALNSVACTEDTLIAHVNMLRNVWRATFAADDLGAG